MSLSRGAEFTLMGMTFMYAVGTLGDKGGDHIIEMLKMQFRQVMEKVCCDKPEDLQNFRVK